MCIAALRRKHGPALPHMRLAASRLRMLERLRASITAGAFPRWVVAATPAVRSLIGPNAACNALRSVLMRPDAFGS